MTTLTYLEFYSGIGGWGYALEHACRSIQATDTDATMSPRGRKPETSRSETAADEGAAAEAAAHPPPPLRAQLLAAYDHSDLCNAVFHHNHLHRAPAASPPSKKKRKKDPRYKPRQIPIERVTRAELESHAADAWCLSPPCQPHTRQHANQHLEHADPRSQSFLHLCRMVRSMEADALPRLILLENVVGFERSGGGAAGAGPEPPTAASDRQREGSFQTWRRALAERRYRVAHFQLDPTDVGLPNARPRHYTVAFRDRGGDRGGRGRTDDEPSRPSTLPLPCSDGTPYDHFFVREALDSPPVIRTGTALREAGRAPPVGAFLDADLSPRAVTPDAAKQQALRIPEKLRASSSSWCFDLATPQGRLSACFTHSYGRFVRGTGSILYTGPGAAAVGDATAEGEERRFASPEACATDRAAGGGDGHAARSEGGAAAAAQGLPPGERFPLASPAVRAFDAAWARDVDWDRHLRYFSGTEIARLLGFPVAPPPLALVPDETCEGPPLEAAATEGGGRGPPIREFGFPPAITTKRQWKLLGNSLNVRVAALVAEMGLRSLLGERGEPEV